MTCTCILDVDVGEPIEVLRESYPIARKQHVCYECGKTIAIGERYFKEATVFCGKFEVYKTCLECLSIRDNLTCSFYYGRVLEDVAEEIVDSGGNVDESCIANLTPKARNWVCDIIEKTWEDL